MRYASSARRTWSALRSTSLKTATVRMSISRSVRAMRTAISPRLAMRTLSNISGQRNQLRTADLTIPGYEWDMVDDARGRNELVSRISTEIQVGGGDAHRRVDRPYMNGR